jgi:hypothetical protein
VGGVKLFELAYQCSLYSSQTNYDASLDKLRRVTAGQLDPVNAEHRTALFTWLNAWGCRQFAIDHHLATAAPSLVSWARIWEERLPPLEYQLTRLSDSEIRLCAASYEALRHCPASLKQGEDGRTITVTFGPTGAAKTLFAMRPNVFAPWDESIRQAMGWGADGASFRAYLVRSADTLRDLCSEGRIGVEDLPAIVGRPNSSPPKLIDEYNWVVYTRRCPPPSVEDEATWSDRVARRLSERRGT